MKGKNYTNSCTTAIEHQFWWPPFGGKYKKFKIVFISIKK